MAFQFDSDILAGRAVSKGYVVVGYVVEEVDLFLVEEESSCDGVDGGITPAFVEEATVFVESLEIVHVGFTPEPVKVTDLKV